MQCHPLEDPRSDWIGNFLYQAFSPRLPAHSALARRIPHWDSASHAFGTRGTVHSTFCLSRTELRCGSLQSFDQIQVSGTSRPGSSQLVAAQGPTCRSVARKAHCQNCTRFLLSRYGGDLLMLSICFTRTRTGEVILVLETPRVEYNSPPWRSRTAGTTSFQSYRFNRFLSG